MIKICANTGNIILLIAQYQPQGLLRLIVPWSLWITVLLLHTDKDPHTAPSVPTVCSALVVNTEEKTAFLSHRFSHTATGCPVEKQNTRQNQEMIGV